MGRAGKDVPANTGQDQEREILYIEEARANNMKSMCEDYCEVLNEIVVPLLEQFEIDIESIKDEVLSLARNTRELMRTITQSEISKNLCEQNKYLKKHITKEVEAVVRDVVCDYFGCNVSEVLQVTSNLSESCKPFIMVDENGVFVPDLAKIVEAYTKYIEGEQLQIWRKLKQATDLLNEVFKGHTPLYVSQIWERDQETDYLRVSPFLRLDLWCNQQEEPATPEELEPTEEPEE